MDLKIGSSFLKCSITMYCVLAMTDSTTDTTILSESMRERRDEYR
jgi:hypothetical protein